MFPQRYFPIRYFTPRYWPPGFISVEIPIDQVAEFVLAITQHKAFDMPIMDWKRDAVGIQPSVSFTFITDPADWWTEHVVELYEFYLAICQEYGIETGIQDMTNFVLPLLEQQNIDVGVQQTQDKTLEVKQTNDSNLEIKQERR